MEKLVENIKLELASFFRAEGISDAFINIERPADFKFGDLAVNAALRYSKVLGKEPFSLAQMMSEHLLSKKIAYIEKVEPIKPGYINIFLKSSFYTDFLSSILKNGEDFGKNNFLKKQKWVIEHTSPNPNKAMHLGHLRNNLVGMSIVRTLEWSGAKVYSDAVDNNRGIAIAKMMWGFLAFMKKHEEQPTDASYWFDHQEEWHTPETRAILPDIFATECYVKGESDFKASEAAERAVRDMVVRWEAHDKIILELWKHVLGFAYEGINRTLGRLGNRWDKVWHEHEHYMEGKNYVEKGLKANVFKRLPDGAVLTDLANYNLADTILLKNDGTSLYVTQDLALTAIKKKYYGAHKLVWVIGPEQSLAMKQMFAICEQLGIGKLDDFKHVPYGYVSLKSSEGGSKKMSSRQGTVILIDEVLDEVKAKILLKIRENNPVVSLSDADHLSEKLALCAVKFSILKSSRNQDLVFDVDQSIEIHGDSGIYVMYSYVRCQSILRKKEKRGTSWQNKVGVLGPESELIKRLMHFEEAIKRSSEDYSAHHISQYLLDLSSAFNNWYGKETVLDASPDEDYKLAVTAAVGIAIKNGFAILGIEVVEKI